MPTSSPAIYPSRGIHSATTDWNSSDESETSPLNSRMAPDFALPITYSVILITGPIPGIFQSWVK